MLRNSDLIKSTCIGTNRLTSADSVRIYLDLSELTSNNPTKKHCHVLPCLFPATLPKNGGVPHEDEDAAMLFMVVRHGFQLCPGHRQTALPDLCRLRRKATFAKIGSRIRPFRRFASAQLQGKTPGRWRNLMNIKCKKMNVQIKSIFGSPQQNRHLLLMSFFHRNK